MIIEFADPGYNFGYMWWAIGLGVVGLVLFFLPLFLFQDEDKIAAWPMVGLLIFLAGSILPVFGGSDYDSAVKSSTNVALTDQGFSDIELSGDRFTAATEDGQYFRGVLVDLEPESGYAYQVLELTGMEK